MTQWAQRIVTNSLIEKVAGQWEAPLQCTLLATWLRPEEIRYATMLKYSCE